MTPHMTDEQVLSAVRERYAAAAQLALDSAPAAAQSCCGNGAKAAEPCCDDTTATAEPCCGGSASADPSCCGGAPAVNSCCGDSATEPEAACCGEGAKLQGVDPISSGLYDEADTPFDAALAVSLGCGNPTALAELSPGEDVLDLGSGGGLDVLLSARRVAPGGTAYGLDMTPQMLALAERHRDQAGVTNAQFLLGEIEDIPMADASVDVVISNCVINLSPDKAAVIGEAFRVLRPGGRFAVSDIVLLREIPDGLRSVVALWTGCISGALRDSVYLETLTAAGFADASIEVTRAYTREQLLEMSDMLSEEHVPAGMTLTEAIDALDGAFASAFIRATKPAA